MPLLGHTHQYARDPFTFMSAVGRAFADTLGTLESKLVLATVASRFELERVDGGPLELRPSLTMHPREPVRMRLIGR